MFEKQTGEIIARYRKLRGMTPYDLALKLDVNLRYIGVWESGLELPDVRLMQRIADALSAEGDDREFLLRKRPMLNIDREEIIIPGLSRTYRFLHISDAHITLYDETETPARAEYAAPRVKMFAADGIGAEKRFDAFCEYIKEHQKELDGVLFTGDIIDFPSKPNIEFMRQRLKEIPVPYVFCLGNHDWSYFDDDHTPHAKVVNRPLFAEWTNGNTFIHKKRIGELTFIAVDNTDGVYEPGVPEALGEMLENEKNVLLLQHDPLYADTLHEDTKTYWHGGDGSVAQAKLEPNIIVRKMITAENSPVRALITGHKHFHHKDMLENGLPQFIVANANNGGATIYEIKG